MTTSNRLASDRTDRASRALSFEKDSGKAKERNTFHDEGTAAGNGGNYPQRLHRVSLLGPSSSLTQKLGEKNCE
jgi:hypothetical protein